MRTLGNILWHFPLFGFVTASIVYVLGLILTATVIALPIGFGLIELGKFLFAPFSHTMINRSQLNLEQSKLWKTYSTLIMIVYFPFGIVLFFLAVVQVLALFTSIIGIPVAIVVAKSIGTLFNPVNKMCVHWTILDELNRRNAQIEIETIGAGS